MNDGPELQQFVISKYKCTNCKWFRKKETDYSDWFITDCWHPFWTAGPFPGYSLGGGDDTPVDFCPVLKERK